MASTNATNAAPTRALCAECRQPMHYTWTDFTAGGQQQVMPCGHHAGIYFEAVPNG